jgi:hypothetical protein
MSAVRTLAQRRGDPVVTSVYLDVDGRHRPVRSECEAAFAQLAENAVQRARKVGGADLARAVGADVERMRVALARLGDRSAVRGVAMFACSGQSFFETVALPRPVRDEASFGPAPHLLQLVGALDEYERFLAVLVDWRRLRLLRVELGEVTELPALVEPAARSVDVTVELGGYGRHRAEGRRGHLRRAAEAVEKALADWPCDRVVVAGPDVSVAGLEEHLGPSVRRLIVGKAGVDVWASPRVVLDAVAAVATSAERRHEAEVVEELRQRTAGGHRGMVGLEDTFAALSRRTVATLVVSDGFTSPGAVCATCGWRGAALRLCPVCRTTTDEVTDIVGLAVAEALAQGAEVEVCQGTELDRLGRIGALERW